ncbi:unnamed protein product [Closterium sp. NIES-64]|nr:unnamed protein product [Closterium sp. NIES-64]
MWTCATPSGEFAGKSPVLGKRKHSELVKMAPEKLAAEILRLNEQLKNQTRKLDEIASAVPGAEFAVVITLKYKELEATVEKVLTHVQNTDRVIRREAKLAAKDRAENRDMREVLKRAAARLEDCAGSMKGVVVDSIESAQKKLTDKVARKIDGPSSNIASTAEKAITTSGVTNSLNIIIAMLSGRAALQQVPDGPREKEFAEKEAGKMAAKKEVGKKATDKETVKRVADKETGKRVADKEAGKCESSRGGKRQKGVAIHSVTDLLKRVARSPNVLRGPTGGLLPLLDHRLRPWGTSGKRKGCGIRPPPRGGEGMVGEPWLGGRRCWLGHHSLQEVQYLTAIAVMCYDKKIDPRLKLTAQLKSEWAEDISAAGTLCTGLFATMHLHNLCGNVDRYHHMFKAYRDLTRRGSPISNAIAWAAAVGKEAADEEPDVTGAQTGLFVGAVACAIAMVWETSNGLELEAIADAGYSATQLAGTPEETAHGYATIVAAVFKWARKENARKQASEVTPKQVAEKIETAAVNRLGARRGDLTLVAMVAHEAVDVLMTWCDCKITAKAMEANRLYLSLPEKRVSAKKRSA